MKFDIFFSICQTEVDGQIPSEKVMFQNFFSQVRAADELGFETAWVAESHLSSEVQKQNPQAVIPSFKGEIGLNTDILQLAHKVFSQTKRINVGSAIRNILCNGGPMAHAEEIRTFLSLHGLEDSEKRLLEIGFASGRFPYSNLPYGIKPRNEIEAAAWPVLKNLIFQEATEVFLRFLKGEVFNSKQVTSKVLTRAQFRSDEDWQKVVKAWQKSNSGEPAKIEIPSWWEFENVGVIPKEAPMHLLRLTIGAHDAATQNLANQFLPVGVFNLSITPSAVIEETHQRMKSVYKGSWSRSLMPRTALVFIDKDAAKARAQAEKALSNYWRAMEGTLDPAKVAQAVENALMGTPEQVLEQVNTRFHSDDRLMLWFDFNNHDTRSVENSMSLFMQEVAPKARGLA